MPEIAFWTDEQKCKKYKRKKKEGKEKLYKKQT